MAHRPGFLIPNSNDPIVSYRQAEPDAGDFSVLGNDRYGVFYGCLLAVNTLSLALTGGPHIVMSNGTILVIESAAEITLNTGSSTDRFDLVGWDTTSSALTVVPGAPVDDPTFPDLPADFVLFAAAFVPAGASSITASNVIDKRVLLLNGARGAAAADAMFLQNRIPGVGVGFQALGDGSMSWSDGIVSLALTDDQLTVSGRALRALNGLNVTGAVTVTGPATVSGVLTASNYKRGAGDPNGLSISGEYGDEFSNTLTGQKYIWRGEEVGWAEIYADEYPPGTIISSLLTGTAAATHMVGWIPLLGGTFSDAEMGRIPDLGEPFSAWDNGNGTWTVPNLTSKFLGGGTPGDLGGANQVVLSVAQLPSHQHFGGAGATGSGGGHGHTIAVSGGGDHVHTVGSGSHSHTVSDPGHFHNGNHGDNVPTNFIVAEWGGVNKIDGPFHDTSHTWSVGPAIKTTINTTGVTIPASGAHSHTVAQAGSHTHTATVTSAGAHTHTFPTETAVGQGNPVSTVPAHLGVTYYVKV
jgi:hypothetical protein